MSKITSCLWFDKKAEEAARFYVSLLPGSRIDFILPYCMEMPGGSPGDVMTELPGAERRLQLPVHAGRILQY